MNNHFKNNFMVKSNINLNDLLRLIFPTDVITWLSERKDSDLIVQWVCLDVESGQEGDLLLLPSNKFNKNSLKTAVERGVVAILIIGEISKLKNISPKIPTLLINTQKDFRQIQRDITKLLTSKNSVLNERKLQIHTILTKLAAERVGLEDLARVMHEITHHGILIHDKRLNIIADVPTSDLQSSWEDVTEQLCQIENLPEPLHDRHQAGEQNIKLIQNLSEGISRVIVPIIVGNVARGYLSVIGVESSLSILDHLVAEEGALICAIDMSRTKAVRETEKKLQSDLLTALLQEDLSPRDAKLWIEAMGLDKNQAHAALQFIWDSPNPPSRRRLETSIHGEVIRMGIKVILNPAGEAIICFCQVPPNDNGYQLALKLGANVLEQTINEFPNAPVRCGIGSPTSLNRWHISFREAGLALDMATRLKKDKPLYYPDLSIYRLLLLLETNPELKAFQEDTLGTLLLHENRNEFIRTLEAFFEQNGNLSQTAKVLFIHRNTLSYRLKQISEIAGLDLKNCDTALAVQLALRISRMMHSKIEIY